MLNPIFWKKVQGEKHLGRWGIVEHQMPSIKVLFKTNATSHKHPGIKLLSSESKTQLVNQRKQNSYRRAHTHTHTYIYIYISTELLDGNMLAFYAVRKNSELDPEHSAETDNENYQFVDPDISVVTECWVQNEITLSSLAGMLSRLGDNINVKIDENKREISHDLHNSMTRLKGKIHRTPNDI